MVGDTFPGDVFYEYNTVVIVFTAFLEQAHCLWVGSDCFAAHTLEGAVEVWNATSSYSDDCEVARR